MKNKTSRISISDEDVDLQPIYDFCSVMRFFKPDPTDSQNIESVSGVDETQRQRLREVCGQIIRLVKNGHTKFQPGFIEVSLYDPGDRTGKIFFSVFIAENETAILSYFKELSSNLVQGKSTPGSSSRGPLIPSRQLHSSVYYSKIFSDEINPIHFDGMSDTPAFIYAGKFVNLSLKTPDTRATVLDQYVDNFFSDVHDKSFRALAVAKGRYLLNTALLIPLFRPAARFKGETEYIFNGGGIFLYGHLEDPATESQLVLELQTHLTKSLFKVSHNKMAVEEIESFKNVYASMVIHQMKNKLSTLVVGELGRIFSKYTIEPELKERLAAIRTSAYEISESLAFYFKNLAFSLLTEEKQIVDVEKFEEVTDQLKKNSPIPVDVPKPPENSSAFFRGRSESLDLILKELIENARRYYVLHPVNDPGVRITWMEDSKHGDIKIETLSKHTEMDSAILKNYGHGPISDTNSTGLGGFFMNRVLEALNAKRFPDGRYFTLENKVEGFVIAIYFRLYNKPANHG